MTTDDPADDLKHHKKIKEDGFEVKVLPAFRPDKAMEVSNAIIFNAYINKLEKISAISIMDYKSYPDALKQRHDFFQSMGCTVSDHGLEHLYAYSYTDSEIKTIFAKLRNSNSVSLEDR